MIFFFSWRLALLSHLFFTHSFLDKQINLRAMTRMQKMAAELKASKDEEERMKKRTEELDRREEWINNVSTMYLCRCCKVFLYPTTQSSTYIDDSMCTPNNVELRTDFVQTFPCIFPSVLEHSKESDLVTTRCMYLM